MVLLPGCKCCGKKDCWRCYQTESNCAGIVKYWAEVADQYEDSFRLTGYGIDTDARPPDRQTGDSFLAWDGPPFNELKYNVTGGGSGFPAISFSLGNILSDNRTRQFVLYITACVMIAGEKNYRFECVNFSGESPELSIVKHVSQDGVETVVNTGSGVASFEIPMTHESPFFLGQYIAEYSDGSNVVIELRDTYKLLIPYKEYQCFENPPTEEGWIATGDCHKTEAECAESCGPCWRCYGKYDLPDNCGELPDACLCDGKEYSIPDTFKGVLSYDSIEYNPASSLAESEVDFGQLQELLDSGKSGMTFTRSTLLPLGTDPNSWVFNNTPDGSIVPERCGDFSGDISSVSRLDLNCSGPAKPFFNGSGFQASGVGQANYYNTILPILTGLACAIGVYSILQAK